MHPVIADNRGEIAAICQRYRVQRLEVFGSAARGTDFDPESSDADFLVAFQPPVLPDLCKRYDGMTRDLQALLGREVDLIRLGTIDNKYLQRAIDRSREVVYDQAA